jgi:hypothetical protein
MSNWIDMRVDVLAPSSDEINKIEKALQEPCEDLLTWAAERGNQRVEDIREDVRLIVRLTAARNLGLVDPSLNKARRFESEWKDRHWGLVWSHVYFVSRAFPNSIFLAEYWDTSMSYAGKVVIRANREIRHIYDGNQQARGREWVLPDIFAPYRTEYDIDADFGMFWDAWLLEVEGSVAKLKERYGTPKADTTCESALVEWERKFQEAAEFVEHNEETEERDI